MTTQPPTDQPADIVHVVGGYMRDYFYLECEGCGQETEPMQDMTVTEVLAWVGDHDHGAGSVTP